MLMSNQKTVDDCGIYIIDQFTIEPDFLTVGKINSLRDEMKVMKQQEAIVNARIAGEIHSFIQL